MERLTVLKVVYEPYTEVDDVRGREELTARLPFFFSELTNEVHVRLSEHIRGDTVPVKVVCGEMFNQLSKTIVVKGVGVDVVGPEDAL
jgi:hypothetical protein